jgi:carboxylesterase
LQRLKYCGLKSSTAIILIHGLCSTPDEFFFQSAELARAGYHVAGLKIPGYSFDESLVHQQVKPWQSWVEQLETCIGSMRQQFKQVLVGGISAGANIVLAMVLRQRVVCDGVVLISTPLKLNGWNIPFYQFLLPLALYTPLGVFWSYKESAPFGVKDERVRSWIERQMQTRKVSSAGASMLETPFLREHDRIQRWLRHELKSAHLDMPVLAIHSVEDEVADMRNLNWLRQAWKTDCWKELVLSDCYHMVTIDSQRARVTRAMMEFAALKSDA